MITLSYHAPLPRPPAVLWVGGFFGAFLIAASTIGLTISLDELLSYLFGLLPFLPISLRVLLVVLALSLICVGWPLLGVRILRKAFRRDRYTLLLAGALAFTAFGVSACLFLEYMLQDPNPWQFLHDPTTLLYVSPMPLACAAALCLLCVTLTLLVRHKEDREVCESYQDTPLFRLFEDVCMASPVVALLGFLALVASSKILEMATDFRMLTPALKEILLGTAHDLSLPLVLIGLPFLAALPCYLYRVWRSENTPRPRSWPLIPLLRLIALTLVAAGIGMILTNFALPHLPVRS